MTPIQRISREMVPCDATQMCEPPDFICSACALRHLIEAAMAKVVEERDQAWLASCALQTLLPATAKAIYDRVRLTDEEITP